MCVKAKVFIPERYVRVVRAMSVAEAEQYLKRAEETFQDADDELKLT